MTTSCKAQRPEETKAPATVQWRDLWNFERYESLHVMNHEAHLSGRLPFDSSLARCIVRDGWLVYHALYYIDSDLDVDVAVVLQCTRNIWRHHSILKFERLAASDVDGASTIATTFLLVLLLGEALASCDRQVIVCSLSIVIIDVGVANVTVRRCFG